MPSTQKQWTVAELTGFDGLKLATDAPVPQVGENDVLVKCKLLDLANGYHFPKSRLLTVIESPRRLAQLP
jgi:hypothetical protein